jgi:hypothetical protein
MSDTANTLATASGATPVAAKTIKSQGIINQKQARTLARAELAAAAAQHPDRVNTMTVRGILPEYAESVVTDVGAARDKVALIVNSTTARKVATAAEARTAEFLLDGLREVQKAAKQKYARTNRLAMEDYFVGKHLNGSRPNLLQTSQAILDKLAVDTLPGFTAAKIQRLKDARSAWVDANAEQVAHASAATTARAGLRTLLRSIEDRRLAIQLAADAEWPHTDDEHAGIRREFSMAPKRPVRV